MIKGGARIQVRFEDVFPAGCVFVPDSVAPVEDYDAASKTRTPQFDKVTGSRVWQCRVMDADPELGGQSREVVVKILADHQPVPASRLPDGRAARFDAGHVRPRGPGLGSTGAEGHLLRHERICRTRFRPAVVGCGLVQVPGRRRARRR